MSEPAISVVMSVYNNKVDLPQAVDSIVAQTMRNWELILVDDGSKDGSSEIMDDYAKRDSRIRVIHQANAGLGNALALGCLEAKSDLIARHDADDWSAPERFTHQLAYLARNPDVVVVGTWAWFIHPLEGAQFALKIPDNDMLHRRFLNEGINPFLHGSTVFKREIYLKEKYRFRCMVEDIDLWIRMARHGRLGMVESLDYFYRLSSNGISFSYQNINGALLELVQKLDSEWKQFGCEKTDWKTSERIISQNSNPLTKIERDTADHFMHGVHCLKRRKYREFMGLMKQASEGQGPLAKKAKSFLPLGILPASMQRPLLSGLRRLVLFKNRNKIDPFIEYT